MAFAVAPPSTLATPWGNNLRPNATRANGNPRLSLTPLLSVRHPLNSRPCRLRVFAASSNAEGASSTEASNAPSTATTTGSIDVGSSSAGEYGRQTESSATSSGSRSRRVADSTDWIASAVTRRFGIGAGLAWVGFLAFGVVSEQIKTRTEVFLEESNTRDVEDAEETVLPSGVRFTDLRVGGGASPQRGDLVLVSLTGRASLPALSDEPSSDPVTFIDTTAPGGRDMVFSFGVRPFAKGETEGLVAAMTTMRSGGKRKVLVPAELGYGESGESFGNGVTIPGGAVLEYVIELKRVSIPPS